MVDTADLQTFPPHLGKRPRIDNSVHLVAKMEFVGSVRSCDLDTYSEPLGGTDMSNFIVHHLKYDVVQLWEILDLWRLPTGMVHVSTTDASPPPPPPPPAP